MLKLKAIKSKKGMTLMELIMGISVFCILAVSVSAIIGPVMTTISKVSSYSEVNGILDTLSNEFTADLSEASVVSFVGDEITIMTSDYYIISYNVVDGILSKNGGALLSKDFYKDKIVDLKVYDAELTTDISDINTYVAATSKTRSFLAVFKAIGANGEVMLQKSYAVRPLIMNQYN